MPDKEKRKSNPRRRLLIRLIIGFAIIGAVIAIGIEALRPKGTQIVFIAPDDNGVDNIWIADLNDPENPRQLTSISDNSVSYRQSLNSFQVGNNGNLLFWIKNGDDPQDLYFFDKDRHETYQLMVCDKGYATCGDNTHVLSPDGHYIAYEQVVEEPANVFAVNLMLYDTRTEEHQLIYEHNSHNVFGCTVCPQWIGNGEVLAYRSNGEEYTIYNVEESIFLAEHTLGYISFKPLFSNDGTRYIYHDETVGSDRPNFAMYVHSTLSPDNAIFTFPPTEPEQDFTISYRNFHDWHPDNEQVLMVEEWQQANSELQLNLYNVLTGEHDTLLQSYQGGFSNHAQFNAEGTQIILSMMNRDIGQSQIMLYDMERREEIPLSLFGYSPQWVNGGR